MSNSKYFRDNTWLRKKGDVFNLFSLQGKLAWIYMTDKEGYQSWTVVLWDRETLRIKGAECGFLACADCLKYVYTQLTLEDIQGPGEA